MTSSSRATYIPRSYLAALPPDSEISMSALVAEQDRLADEAREAMPYAFDECSYGKGYLRQSVWSCVDCGGKGVCYGCSISCHSEHKLVELWTRRSFRCDCPTTCMQPEPLHTSTSSSSTKRRRCTLNPPQIQPAENNEENRYNKNYQGDFCRCGRVYDPMTETEGMLCCIGCEDWFHETCLNLRPVQPSHDTAVENTPVKPYPQPDQSIQDPAIPPSSQGVEEEDEEDDEEAGILIPSESYDCLICAGCVKGSKALSDRAGRPGWMQIARNTDGVLEVVGKAIELADHIKLAEGENVERMIGKLEWAKNVEVDGQKAGGVESSGKRSLEVDTVDVESKRVKLEAGQDVEVFARDTKGDIFLAHGEREKLKKELSAIEIAKLPFPLDDEEIYEPPKDENADETLDEVTARVVDTLPRAQAIEAVHGYQRLRDSLQNMLAGHAVDGRVVSRTDIEEMFETLRGRAGRQ